MASALSSNGYPKTSINFFDSKGVNLGEWDDYSGPIPDVGDEVCVRSFGHKGIVSKRTFHESFIFIELDI